MIDPNSGISFGTLLGMFGLIVITIGAMIGLDESQFKIRNHFRIYGRRKLRFRLRRKP